MYFTNILSATAFALSAKAFLIPLEIAEDVKAAKEKATDNLVSIFHQNSRSINLDCSSCPFALSATKNGAHVWTDDVESELQMSFVARDKHLTMNGKPFYPATLQDLPGALYAPQINKDDSRPQKIVKGLENGLKLSYSLEFEGEKAQDGNELVTVTMSILGIEEKMVRVDNVQIKAIKEADGSLSLFDVKPVPASEADARCTNMLCRVMTKLSVAIAKARAKAMSAAHATTSAAKKVKCFCVRCFHRMAGHQAHHRPAVKAGEATRLPTHNVVRPGHFRAHHGAHHHGFFHSILGFARHMFTFVLLPVMVGIAVGITASAIGMLVGQAVVFLWLRYRRNGNRQQGAYESVETDDKEDNLPAYDAEGLPAYMDVEDEKKDVEEKA